MNQITLWTISAPGRCWPIGKRKEEAFNAARMKLACRSITPNRVRLTNGTRGVPCIRHRSFICLRAYSLLFHRLVIHGRTGTLCCKSLSVHVSTINCVLPPYRERVLCRYKPLRKCGSMTSCPEQTGHTEYVRVRVWLTPIIVRVRPRWCATRRWRIALRSSGSDTAISCWPDGHSFLEYYLDKTIISY